MPAKVLNGNKLAKEIKAELREEVSRMRENGIIPGLAVIIVGDNPASRVYVDFKKKDCSEIGIESYEYALSGDTSEKELIELIEKLNNDRNIHGILVQLPLPGHINEERIISSIRPEKDADCFHPYNVGRLMTGSPTFKPCTPAGIVELLKENGIEIAGRECVIVNRSNIVGKPLAILMLSENATVTVCHSKTKDLKSVCRRADILIAAVGRAEFFTTDYVKPGAVVIDVGVNRDKDNKLVGDVDFDSVSQVASAITKVTGGVGPMTRAMLMMNTVYAAGQPACDAD